MSEPNAFTGADLDRAGDGRRADPDWIEAQRTDERARALVLGNAGLRAEGGRLARLPLGEVVGLAGAGGAGGDGPGEPILLGDDGDGPLWVVDADLPAAVDGREEGSEPGRPRLVGASGQRDISPGGGPEGWLGLREAVTVLPAAEGGLVAYAAALLNWHRAHRFCANCGAPTELAEGGMVRACPSCRSQHHPRTDPVVIMLVVGPAGALLGRRADWPANRYSALAGFVSPGESLEEAVAREVVEEAGVEIGRPRYVSSQPWPFPASLMLGFIVPWSGGEIGGSDPELEDVRWFARADVAEAARFEDDWTSDAPTDGLQLPPRTAIARRLVEEWLDGGG